MTAASPQILVPDRRLWVPPDVKRAGLDEMPPIECAPAPGAALPGVVAGAQSGGDTGFVPGDHGTALFDLDADDDNITTVSGNVSAWPDKEGNGWDADQSSSGSRPAFNATGWSASIPTVDFDRTNSEYMDVTVPSALSTSTLVFAAVLDHLDTSDVHLLWDSDGGSGNTRASPALTLGGGPDVRYIDSSSRDFSVSARTGKLIIIWEVNSGATSNLRQRDSGNTDTGTNGSITVNGVDADANVVLGARNDGADHWCNMRLARLVCWTAITSTLVQIESGLNDIYGVF